MGRGTAWWTGVALGVVLAQGRAPLGLDWIRWAAVDGPTRAAVGASALGLCALVLGAFAGRAPLARGTELLAGALAGFVGAGLALDPWLRPETPRGWAMTLSVPAALGALLLARARPRTLGSVESGASDPQRAEPSGGLTARRCLALLALGAGASIALGTLARPLASLGLALAEDGAVLGAVFLALLLLGALAFGPLLQRPAARNVALGFLPALAALGALVGWWFLGRFEGPGGLAAHLSLFGLRPGDLGTAGWNAALCAPALVAAAFPLGAWASAASDRRQWAALLAGAALGLAALLFLREGWAVVLAGEEARAGLRAQRGLSVGALVAGAGAAVWALDLCLSRSRGALASAVCALLALVAAASVSPRPLLLLSPWQDVPVEAEWVLETSDGLLTVESTRQGDRIATLDRRLLGPAPWDVAGDAERIAVALGSVGVFSLNPDAPRILFVGLMTAERAAALGYRPGVVLERTAPWHPYDGVLERLLRPGGAPWPGTRITPAQARRRLAQGYYDAVIAAPAGGVLLAPRGLFDRAIGPPPRPMTGGLNLPAGTAGLAWADASAGLSGADLGAVTLVQLRGLDDPHVGVLAGEARHWPMEAAEGRRVALPAGAARTEPAGLWQSLRPARLRSQEARARWFARLGSAVRDDQAVAPLARALDLHFAAQAPSPTWATAAEATEWDPASMPLFAAAAMALDPDPFVRRLLEDVAGLLLEKSLYEEILAHVLPVAEARGPWAGLERVLVESYRELLAPELALARLGVLLDLRPGDGSLWLEKGELERELGRPEALESLYRAADLGLAAYDRRRRLAVALLGFNDPRGRAEAEDLLRENPFDNDLRDLLRAGPMPR